MKGFTISPRHIVLFVPSLGAGGAEKSALQLAKEFTLRGVRVTVVTAHESLGTSLSPLPSIRLVKLRTTRTIFAVARLSALIRAERPSVVISFMDHANVVSLLAQLFARTSTKVVVSVRSSELYSDNAQRTLRANVLLWLTRILYRRSDAIHCVSHDTARLLSRKLNVPDHKLHVIPNPVDIVGIEKKARMPLPLVPLNTAKPFLLGVGRLHPQKDFETLLRALRILNQEERDPLPLIILGEGPEEARLKNLTVQLGLSNVVLFLGFAKNPMPFFRATAAFVLSSRFEGWPGALIEAMACGAPVIASDCQSGPSEILADGRWGRLVPPDDPESLARAIRETLDSPDHPDTACRARDFEAGLVMTKYMELLEIL